MISELESLVRFMRENGVVNLKHNGTEILLGPAPVKWSKSVGELHAQAYELANQQGLSAPPDAKELTDDDLLFAAVRGLP